MNAAEDVIDPEPTAEHVIDPEPAPEHVLDPEPAAETAPTPPLTKPPFTPTAPRAEEIAPEDADALLDANAPQWANDETTATALTWVDATAVAAHSPTATLDQAAEPERTGGLLRGARLRPGIARPGILVPLATLAGLVAVYAGTTLLWPLHEVPPTVAVVEFSAVPAPPAALTWPGEGSAAVGIAGLDTAASLADPVSIASITKVVSSLMVLDRMPLALGEQGPEFGFTYRDSVEYWDYRRSDQSALDVPVGGVLTEYQLLQGTLLGSANNYIDRLASEIWGSDREFAAAAEVWLRERGLTGITVVTPSGFDERNVSTPEALIALGELAMQNPVFAQIVGTTSVDLPGAGTVVNTNGMLVDPGVVGIKTGTLVGWNLLTAKDVTIGDTTVHLYAAALNQPGDDERLAVTRSLFAETEAALAAQDPAVAEGTVVGRVTTLWGEDVDVVTESDADVVLWNGALATTSATFDLGDERDEHGRVGTMTATGPLDSTTVPLVLAEDVEGPSPWWRLTHPLELLGVTADRP
ncbi:D-alanyl-D-alanine carboxypeptidase [Microbacterium sp. Se63.02b]|uniref:D-alanyl-D-alanine carboxypeptidase n=1 Tax=Microbacterium sp. Se63.02b TaxID=2709304 RepID=UPI001604F903|nr:D-alanyl-D-alanine carboxypeptidase [Microbacterium sp. Se63.02b]QNA93753.1 D-alanyl-D-alanine carboxypeptidase [Microbacterium sp. Se63.02b]